MKRVLRILCLVGILMTLCFTAWQRRRLKAALSPVLSVPVGPDHKGVDIGVPEGTPVVAPFDGYCEGGFGAKFGYWVLITNKDTGEAWLFGDLSDASDACARGDVHEGDVIGYVGGAFGYPVIRTVIPAVNIFMPNIIPTAMIPFAARSTLCLILSCSASN